MARWTDFQDPSSGDKKCQFFGKFCVRTWWMTSKGICGEIFNILQDFLGGRKQRVVLISQCSSQADIWAGVPQKSIFGPFVVFNDLSNDIKSKCKLFGDDIDT